MYPECLRCLERSFHMQDEIKLQVKKETPHVEIFIYEIFLTVFLVYVSEQMFLQQYEINSVQNHLGLLLVDFVLSLFRTDEGTFVPKCILEKL